MPLRLIALPLLSLLLTTTAQAGTVNKETRFGAFTLVEEVRTRDPGEPPIMHVATEWTKLHLIWRSADQAVTADFVDDGRFLDLNVTINIDAKSFCASTSAYFQYGRSDDQAALWRSMRNSMTYVLRHCPHLSPAARRNYAAALNSASDDFLPAIAAFQKHALALFPQSGVKRCLAPPPAKGPPEFMLHPGRICHTEK